MHNLEQLRVKSKWRVGIQLKQSVDWIVHSCLLGIKKSSKHTQDFYLLELPVYPDTVYPE